MGLKSVSQSVSLTERSSGRVRQREAVGEPSCQKIAGSERFSPTKSKVCCCRTNFSQRPKLFTLFSLSLCPHFPTEISSYTKNSNCLCCVQVWLWDEPVLMLLERSGNLVLTIRQNLRPKTVNKRHIFKPEVEGNKETTYIILMLCHLQRCLCNT